MDTTYAIKTVKASVVFKPSSGAAPFTVGTIDYTLPSAVSVPSKGSVVTDEWPVSIVGSGLEHLGQLIGMLLDPNKYFDVQQNVTVSVGDGYVTEMFYYQDKVPFTIQIDGLPPIGITAASLSTMSLPANLTSITDPNQLEQALKDFLSGKKPETSSVIPPSSAAAAISASSAVSIATTATNENKPTTTAANDPPTTTAANGPTTTTAANVEKPTTTGAPTATETTTSPRFELPF
jgi:hypothetical protein